MWASSSEERFPDQQRPAWLCSFRPQNVGIYNLRNPHFIGRDELLDRLDQQLSSGIQEHGTATNRVTLTQAIKRLGGIGKTQIAVEYAYRSRDLNRYVHTFWVNAASAEVLLTSFVEIAELLPAFSAKGETDQH